jgi:ketosteroid isomerase-like protein
MTPKDTIESIYAAFGRGDIPFILGQLAPNVVWRQPGVPWGGERRGPAGAGEFFTKLNETVETTGFDVEENLEAGNQVVSFGYYSSRNRATGKSARSRFIFRWQVTGGKVTLYDAVVDSAPIIAATLA